MSLLEKMRENIELVVNAVSGLEALLGLALLIGGIMVSAGRKMISSYAFLLSNNIEMALMFKKERIKLNAASSFLYVLSLILFSFLSCSLAKSMEVSERVLNFYVISLFVLSVTLISIIVMILGAIVSKRLQGVHIFRFFMSLVKSILCKFIVFVGNITVGIRNICKNRVNSIKEWKFVISIHDGYMKILVFFKTHWNESGINIEKEVKRTVYQQLRIMGFILATIWGIIFSYLGAIFVEGQRAYGVSILGTIIIAYIAIIFLGHHIEPNDAKVYFKNKDKNIFVFYRIDDDHCIGGDAHILSQCSTKVYIPFKEIEMQDLYPVSKWIQENADAKTHS